MLECWLSSSGNPVGIDARVELVCDGGLVDGLDWKTENRKSQHASEERMKHP